MADPEVGDIVIVKENGRRADIRAIIPSVNEGARPIYVLRYRRVDGARICLFREEFDADAK